MPTYVLLTTFTQQGAENVRDRPERTEHAKQMVESLGGTWKGFFVTMGRYDGVVIAGFPDDSTAATAVLTLASSGNVTTETLRAFPLDEFRSLYEAALEHGAVRHYHSCTPAERDELKAHLAQRYEMEKTEVGVKEFKRANSFKIPSIVSVSLDCGLRPVEVGRAKTYWVNFEENSLDIPKEESSKNEDNWKCVLSEKSVRALEKWVDERSSYEKYADRDDLWLNKGGNPYGSDPLTYLLNDLIEAAGIEPAGRDLTWYSIRHGVATVWADEENIHDAREQLRYKNVETTIGYAHSGTENRHNSVNSKW